MFWSFQQPQLALVELKVLIHVLSQRPAGAGAGAGAQSDPSSVVCVSKRSEPSHSTQCV